MLYASTSRHEKPPKDNTIGSYQMFVSPCYKFDGEGSWLTYWLIALAICGDAVEAEFEDYLHKRQVTEKDCPKNLKTTLSKICTWFKEKKKMCGDGSDIETADWHIPFPHLRADQMKGFEDDSLPIPRYVMGILLCIGRVEYSC